MPGMPLSGQTWPVAAGSFVASWMVMMVPMMLPSLVPVLWRWTRSGHAMALVGVAYYLVWAAYGLLAYALSIGVTAAEVRWPALASFAPAATGVVLLLAGGLQLTAWKVRQLASCWDAVSCGASAPAPPTLRARRGCPDHPDGGRPAHQPRIVFDASSQVTDVFRKYDSFAM